MDTVSTLPELPDTNLGDKSTRLSGGKPRQETAYVNTIWGSVWSGLVQDHDPEARFSCNAMLLSLTYHTHFNNTTSPSLLLKCAPGTSLSPFLKYANNRRSVHRHRYYSNPSSN